MATVVQGSAKTSEDAFTALTENFTTTPTSGNLLVMFYGARDDDSSGVPTFTVDAGFTKVAEASPMEYHTCGIAWRVADGTETGNFGITTGEPAKSGWVGLVEFNETGVSDWQLDKQSDDGAGATNVASIATGTTGTLGSATGVAAIAGTSRTNREGLTTDTGTSLSGTDVDFEVDAEQANYIAAWLSLAATTALDATISESSGNSRMGAVIATFIEAVAAGSNGTASASLVISASGAGNYQPAVFNGTGSAALTFSASGVGDYAPAGSTTSLYPTGDGTLTTLVDEADVTTGLFDSIDDDPATPTDTDWINNSSATGSGFFDVTNLPADFATMDSAEVVVRYRGQNFGTGTVTLYAQLFQSDETTTLSNEVQVASVTADTAFANSAAVTFTGINTTAAKTVWDAALIRFRWA